MSIPNTDPPANDAAPSWRAILTLLYGETEAKLMAPRVEELISKYARRRTGEQLWDESDVWVITYPDQFTRVGEAPLATLREFMNRHLRPEFSGVHILPFFPYSSDEGFAVKDFLVVDATLGSWESLEEISSDWRLMVDAVVNHASSQGDWFERWQAGDPEYRATFRTAEPSADLSAVTRAREHPLLTKYSTSWGEEWVWTTFSADQADLDYRNPRVLERMLEVLLVYCSHGADVLRLDAACFLWKDEGTPSINLPQTHLLVQLMRSSLEAACPGILVITETNVPHAENLSYLGAGGVSEAHAVYQFPLPPLTLHAFTTGNSSTLKEWLRGLQPLANGTTVVNFLGSHDGVGLRPIEGLVKRSDVESMIAAARANGAEVSLHAEPSGGTAPYEINATWFDLIRGPSTGQDAEARHLASHAIMLALAGIPAVYIHSLLASGNDRQGFHATEQPRSINRQRITDVDSLEGVLLDGSTRPARTLVSLKSQINARRSSNAFHPDSAQELLPTGHEVLGIQRRSEDGSVARVYVNVTGGEVVVGASAGTAMTGNRHSTADGRLVLGPWGYAWMTLADDDAAAPG